MARPAHSWGWDSMEQGGHYPWGSEDQHGLLLLDQEDCLEADPAPEPSSEMALEQFPLMISSRLEQALEFRQLEEQLVSLKAQLDFAIEALRLTASNESAKDLVKTWQGYLISLLVDGPLARDQVLRAMDLWETLRSAAGNLNPPHAAALESGAFSMAWDKGRHHFEIELQPGGLFDWFYLDRSTDQFDGEQDLPVGYTSAVMLERMVKSAL